MRPLTVLIFLCLTIGCETTTMSSHLLNGTWTPVRQELGGKELPPIVFANQKLTMSDSTYTLAAESIDKGIVIYSKGEMDIYGKEGVNAGKHFTAIYEIENEQLKVCYNLSGDSYPETFETKDKPMYFISVFKKELVK